jgi:hypothetical protein
VLKYEPDKLLRGLVVLKRVVGHVITFTLGTLVSGSVALAATNMIQAQKLNANIVVAGKAHGTTELVYNGKAYLPVSDIQGVFQQAGITSKWNSGRLTVTLPSKSSGSTDSSGSNGTSGSTGNEIKVNLPLINAITSSMLDMGSNLQDLGNNLINAGKTNDETSAENTCQTFLTKLQSNYQKVSQVQPNDAAGQKILTDYLAVLSQYQTAVQDLLTALQKHDTSLLNKAQDELTAANTALANFNTEWDAFLKS